MSDQAQARLYGEPWPPFARDPFQGPPETIAPAWAGPRHGQAPRPRKRLWPWLALVAVVAAIVAAVLLAVQGGNAKPSAATVSNVKACQDYRAQGADAKGVDDADFFPLPEGYSVDPGPFSDAQIADLWALFSKGFSTRPGQAVSGQDSGTRTRAA